MRIFYDETKIVNSNSAKNFVRWQEGTLDEYRLNLEKRYEELHGKYKVHILTYHKKKGKVDASELTEEEMHRILSEEYPEITL